LRTLPVTAVHTTTQRARSWVAHLRIRARYPGDLIFRGVATLFVLVVLGIVLSVAWILVSSSWPTISGFGFRFLTNTAFDPVHNVYGVAPAIFGTFVTSLFAIVIALPVGVGTAIFLVDYCPLWLRSPVSFLVDSLAAIPSVVIGMWGFLTFAPWLQHTGEPWLQRYLGFLPFFSGHRTRTRSAGSWLHPHGDDSAHRNGHNPRSDAGRSRLAA